MKKFFLLALTLFSFSAVAKPLYKSSMTELKVGNNPLLIRIFTFDDLETGRKLAEENYGIKNFLSIAQEKDFKRLHILFPDDAIHGWEYGMFKTENEFWVFRNKGDGYLYGTGRFLKKY